MRNERIDDCVEDRPEQICRNKSQDIFGVQALDIDGFFVQHQSPADHDEDRNCKSGDTAKNYGTVPLNAMNLHRIIKESCAMHQNDCQNSDDAQNIQIAFSGRPLGN